MRRERRDNSTSEYPDPPRSDPDESDIATDSQPWSNATWGWIAGIAVVVLALMYGFGGMSLDPMPFPSR